MPSILKRKCEAQAIDYLLKPVEDERFYQSLQRAKAYLEGHESRKMQERLQSLLKSLASQPKWISRMAVKNGERMVFLKTNEIDWIEAVGNYLNLHVGSEGHLLR